MAKARKKNQVKEMPYSNGKLDDIYIRYTGLFDFDNLYSAMVDWAKNYGYMFHEKVYKHKVPTPKGAEQEIDWIIDKKVTDFVKYNIKIGIHTWDMREVLVDTGPGKKKPLTTGRIRVKITPTVMVDWQKKFKGEESKLFLGFLRKTYFKLMKTEIELLHFDELWYRSHNLQAMIRKVLDMEAKAHPYKGYLGEN